MSRSFSTVYILLLAPTLLGAACENWPLFAHLPGEDPGAGEPSIVAVSEDPLPDRMLQGIGVLRAPSVVTIMGSTDDCGFDETDEWPLWPDHPLDVDGDGTPDTVHPRYSGWFTGETDFFSLTSEDAISVSISLTWANEPLGEFNAPYQPTEEAGDWATESDLDWVVFSVESGAPDVIVSDAGFSTAYPQDGAQRIRIDARAPLALAVGCHHAVPSEYTLVLDVRAR